MQQYTELHPLIKQWLTSLNQRGLSTDTIKAYQRAFNHFSRWLAAHYDDPLDPANIIGRDVRDWKSYQQQQEKAAARTINQRLVALSSFYKWAIVHTSIKQNPTIGITQLRLPSRQPQSLNRKQLRRFLRAVHHGNRPRDVAMVELLVGTGIRVGELLKLEMDDIILKERSGQLIIREGKHGGYREIPLTKEVRHALTSYLAIHPAKNQSSAFYNKANAPLWIGKQGALTHRSSVLRILNKYALQG